MRRRELEHLIRAAAAVTDQYEIVVVGSQSVLGAGGVKSGIAVLMRRGANEPSSTKTDDEPGPPL